MHFLLFLSLVQAFSPANSYAPGIVSCPQDSQLLRPASSIGTEESQWLDKRNAISQANLVDFLKYSANLTDKEVSLVNKNNTVKIGLAFSGGGYRAMYTGAGQIAALDNHTNGAFEFGLGGLLESSTYIGGVSGGTWLVGTLAINNWTSVQTLIDQETIWDTDNSLFSLGGNDVFENLEIYIEWMKQIKTKRKAGYEVSFGDLWGRALSAVFFADTANDASATGWSDLQNYEAFKTANMPFPIAVSSLKINDGFFVSTNSTVMETNAFEFGTWDPSLNGFTSTKYMGTNLTNGEAYDDRCTQGFDNAGFIIGTSSNIYGIQVDNAETEVSQQIEVIKESFTEIIDDVDESNFFESIYPNPFYQSSYGSSDDLTALKEITLIDGDGDGENIPYVPLAVHKRQVDIIFSFDNSADTDNNWPDGFSATATYDRQFSKQGESFSFPYVPDTDTFIKKGFNERPVFFGCNASNLTDLTYIPPLVVYIANSEYSYASNVSTSTLVYDVDKKQAMISNGFEIASMNNLTDDSNWQTCVGCAIIKRSQERLGLDPSDICQQCFDDYCWDGSY